MTSIFSSCTFQQATAWFLSGAAAIALTLTPFAASAQTTELSTPLLDAIEQLDLTAEQQTQLAEIRRNTQAQLEQILTPQQREQFRAIQGQRNALRDAIATMNLSAEQRTQLRQVFQSSRRSASEVLTQEQRQQIRGWLQNQRGQRHRMAQ